MTYYNVSLAVFFCTLLVRDFMGAGVDLRERNRIGILLFPLIGFSLPWNLSLDGSVANAA